MGRGYILRELLPTATLTVCHQKRSQATKIPIDKFKSVVFFQLIYQNSLRKPVEPMRKKRLVYVETIKVLCFQCPWSTAIFFNVPLIYHFALLKLKFVGVCRHISGETVAGFQFRKSDYECRVELEVVKSFLTTQPSKN